MAIASASVRSTNTTQNQANAELIAGANNAYKCMETGMSIVTGTAGSYGFGVPAAIGGTPTTPAALTFEDGGNTSTPAATTALAWSVSPTNPTVYSRRVTLPATIGSGICWTFPRGFAILKAKTLTWSNISATQVAGDFWFVIDE